MGQAKSLVSLTLLLIIQSFLSCSSAKDEFAVSAQEFSLLVKDVNCLVVDIRSPEKYLAGHIEGSATIDYGSEKFEHKFRFLNSDQSIALYSNSVRKSAKALKFLKKELGFTTIVYLDGGLGDWEELGFAISIE